MPGERRELRRGRRVKPGQGLAMRLLSLAMVKAVQDLSDLEDESEDPDLFGISALSDTECLV